MFPCKPVAIFAPTGSKQHQLLPTTRWFTGRFAYNHIHVSPGSCFLPSIVEPSTTKCHIVMIHSVSSTQAHGKISDRMVGARIPRWRSRSSWKETCCRWADCSLGFVYGATTKKFGCTLHIRPIESIDTQHYPKSSSSFWLWPREMRGC